MKNLVGGSEGARSEACERDCHVIDHIRFVVEGVLIFVHTQGSNRIENTIK